MRAAFIYRAGVSFIVPAILFAGFALVFTHSPGWASYLIQHLFWLAILWHTALIVTEEPKKKYVWLGLANFVAILFALFVAQMFLGNTL